MANRDLSPNGLEQLKEAEGLRLDPYQDVAGIWTVGWGHAMSENIGPISLDKAERLLSGDVYQCERFINSYVKVELAQGQFDALVLFVFNVGVGAFARSTLLRLLNAGQYDAIPDQLRRWNKAGGRVVDGLTRRREREVLLWGT